MEYHSLLNTESLKRNSHWEQGLVGHVLSVLQSVLGTDLIPLANSLPRQRNLRQICSLAWRLLKADGPGSS